jgi:putative toxin-antitoxin system antitoxin component (TIGR02293 family)
MPSIKPGTGRKASQQPDKRATVYVLANIKDIEQLNNLTPYEKIMIVKKGISKKTLTDIKEKAELDYEELADILSVSKALIHAKKNHEKFDAGTSERILLLADVLAYGTAVFGDSELFNEWLRSPSKSLLNATPLSLMDTLYGIDEVKKEIGRIAYGVY